MPLFIALCFALATLVEIGSPIQKMLVNPFFLYVGLIAAVIIITVRFFKKIPELLSYDLFCSSALFVWFAYWKPLFVHDSPIFFFFPVYFALSSALATLIVISQAQSIDKANLKLMQSIESSGVADSWLVMCFVLVTLYFENHFLQYPVMMTLLLTRYVLTGCLRNNPSAPTPDFN